ncbi:MAG TPA: type II secretion system protein GspG [Blastocatellia bacterium]|nr:type II secretion system protein GspG [Blastocatellia bacterium]
MKSVPRVVMFAVALLSIAASAAIATNLKASAARERIAQVLGIEKQSVVRIKNISVSANDAVVEAQFMAAFHFTVDKDGKWTPVEVRTGDRRWESIELIQTAVQKEKVLRTTADLRTLATALEAFHRERGSYVTASSAAKLVDLLAPSYVKSVIRLDAWSHEFEYSGNGSSYRLFSRGSDGKAGTGDDIVFENGVQVKGNNN